MANIIIFSFLIIHFLINLDWKDKNNEDIHVESRNISENLAQSPVYSPSLMGKLAFLVNSLVKKGLCSI